MIAYDFTTKTFEVCDTDQGHESPAMKHEMSLNVPPKRQQDLLNTS